MCVAMRSLSLVRSRELHIDTYEEEYVCQLGIKYAISLFIETTRSHLKIGLILTEQYLSILKPGVFLVLYL